MALPHHPAEWLTLALAALTLIFARSLLRPAARPWRFVALTALAAALASAAYVVFYLRGGPRIIDATSYFLEGRALAEGHLAWPLASPATSTLGRFLVRSEGAEGARIAVIFPPGYPALLALGFLVGAPLAIGPLLAAALVVTTYDLAAQLEARLRPAIAASISLPQLAALLSLVCVALRYHTADTMSHGLAALTSSASLALALRALRADRSRLALAAASGFFAGWLLATRPVSALALFALLGVAILGDTAAPRSQRLRIGFFVALGALPGLALLVAHQYAATGSFGLSSQQLYYAHSDGPPSCFRYGFGDGIGCLIEHGDFVRARLPHGFGALEAAGTTLRRLKLHLIDPLNFEPLALLVPAGAVLARGSRLARLYALAVALQIAAYLPFYFDGNYPGGGARFFADVLPFEHVLAATAIVVYAGRTKTPLRLAALSLSLALTGFALRAGIHHAMLRDREGGVPMFERSTLDRAGVASGLVFFDTDHGFNLAFDPNQNLARAAAHGGFEALRFHGDDLDRIAWLERKKPPAFRYRFPLRNEERAVAFLEALSFDPDPNSPLGIEGESLWPPLEQKDGFAMPMWASGTCASAERWLALQPARSDMPASVEIALPAAWMARRTLSPRVALGPGARGTIALILDGAVAHTWQVAASSEGSPAECIDLAEIRAPSGVLRVELRLLRAPMDTDAESAPLFALDRVALSRAAKSIDQN